MSTPPTGIPRLQPWEEVNEPPPVAGRISFTDVATRLRESPAVGMAALLAVALVAGFFWYQAGLRSGADPAGALPNIAAAVPPPSSTTTIPLLVVHVAGAVTRPGLYRLASGSRVADAVEAAGGAGPRADLDRLNLAGRLADGQRVAVARQGEPAPPASGGEDVSGSGATTGEPVDLNTAGQAQLESLPGVGPAMARAILAERGRRGGFTSVRDLLRVPGIGDRRFAELRDRVRV